MPKGEAQKRPADTISLQLRLVINTETAYNNQKDKNNNKKSPSKSWGGGESDFQSYHITRFKCLVFNNKKIKACKETGKYDPFKGKK